MSAPLTPEEREKLETLRERDELERRERHDAKRQADKELRQGLQEVIARRNARATSGPGALERWQIVRAWRRDKERAEGGCDDALHRHAPGSVESVAHRLGVSEAGLYGRRRQLQIEWPPED